jgi:integrase
MSQKGPCESPANLRKGYFQSSIRIGWSVAFMRVGSALDIRDFRFHDLRPTAASWLRMGGSDTHTVAQLLGHKDLRQAARYQHLSPAYLSKAVNQLDETFANCHPYVTAPKAITASATVSD